jgi:hypothetical protein
MHKVSTICRFVPHQVSFSCQAIQLSSCKLTGGQIAQIPRQHLAFRPRSHLCLLWNVSAT